MSRIDVLAESLIDLPTAAREPALRNARTGRPCHLAQIYRYIQVGARSVTGERIRLPVVKTPSGLRTSREAVARWINELSDADRPAPPIRTRARQAQQDRAERELADAGFEVGAVGV